MRQRQLILARCASLSQHFSDKSPEAATGSILPGSWKARGLRRLPRRFHAVLVARLTRRVLFCTDRG
jgi:hypothetical protein